MYGYHDGIFWLFDQPRITQIFGERAVLEIVTRTSVMLQGLGSWSAQVGYRTSSGGRPPRDLVRHRTRSWG